MTSMDTSKESQNPSVKKSFSVGSNKDSVVQNMKSEDQAILEIYYIKESNKAERIWGPKLKNQTFKLLEMIEPSSWFYGCVKSVQIRIYFWSVFSCIRTEYGDLQSIDVSGWTSNHIKKSAS